MQILRLLAARRATLAFNAPPVSEHRDDDGAFFDLDFSCSVRTSSSSSSSISFSDSDDECTELDFIISLQRSSSASPLKFCTSDPPSEVKDGRKRGISSLRTLSFGARKAVPLHGRHSVARSSSSIGRSLRLLVNSPPDATAGEEHHAAGQSSRRAPSRDVIRRCLAKFSRRLRTAAGAEARGLRRLRKCRSASSVPQSSAASRCDDSVVEKQDGIAGAIAHCKDSMHRASTSESDSPLLRSASDPG
ncbi:uncharacterized protein LOC124648186 [Lolium rigidum]|uniref:uncharacterized protein LOC124648186 n=1 Tax=Lolium rigidum TaxID=89674 RepID=UPI001F5D4489|nr:uncharacterized protein LOC124648186 [Lolium rigidum]